MNTGDVTSEATAATASRHPLDPLLPGEIDPVVELVRADPKIGARPRFWGIALDEALAVSQLADAPRPVRLVVMNPEAHEAWEVTAWTGTDAASARLVRWVTIDAKRPGVSSEEARTVAAAVRADPGVRAALAARGITDPERVWVDPESITGFEPDDLADRRLSWATLFYAEHAGDNGYARPIAGLVPIVDLETLTVVRLEDHGVLPLPTELGNYGEGVAGPAREVADLEIVQPDGPGFTIEGRLVRWQNWSFRVGFTHREGLVLQDVRYRDGERDRTVLARAAVNEMYVPYLDPDPTVYRKNFFDWGEYGAGPLTSSLELGCDCLGEIRYFDAHVLTGHGEVRTITNAICLHEEDFSILWRHTNARAGTSEVRRSRRLVISTWATVANYDYGFYWSLYQDGAIELEIKLTGIMSVSAIADGERPAHGRLVARNVQAPNHQHYFAIRLDTAVDDSRNRLVEVHAEPEPDDVRNPHGNACRMVETLIATESAGARRADPARALHWRVESAEARNRFGDPTAYRLTIANTATLYAQPGSTVIRKAPFVAQHLWATRYSPDERFAAGDYPNQAPSGAEGVAVWQRADRSLVDDRLVLWPVLGVHHHPRPEEWPIMPVHRIGLRFEPDGFFDANPSLDLPPPRPAHCHAPGDGDCFTGHG